VNGYQQADEKKDGLIETEETETEEAETEDNRGQTFDLPLLSDLPKGTDGKLEARYTDRFLQTNLTGPTLQTNLLRIEQASLSAMDERGVNILFLAVGFLIWTGAEDSKELQKAPIILIPVTLERTSAKKRFKLLVLDDGHGPRVNPCLVRKMEDFRLAIPEVHDWDEFDLEAYLQKIEKVTEHQANWKVTRGICLGFLSFTKYLMYVDLDEERWPKDKDKGLLDNRLMCAVLDTDTKKYSDLRDLPPGMADPATFDETLDPLNVYQVVDADSSQQKAIVIAKEGKSLVIDGPPGTGKSQTITNVIAECLSAGKKVLFVSEKMAALDVVKRRLTNVGLGDFCLELHSTKANKRAVAEELGRVLGKGQADLSKLTTVEHDAGQIQRLRSSLNEYVKALHDPICKTGISPYRAMGRVAQLQLNSVPDIPCDIPGVEGWDLQQIDHHLELMKHLAQRQQTLGFVAAHPWRGARLTQMEYGKEAPVAKTVAEMASAIKRLVESGSVIAALLGGTIPETMEGFRCLAKMAKLILFSPEPAKKLMEGDTWDKANQEAKLLLEKLQQYVAARQWLKGRYEPGLADGVDWRAFHKNFEGYWKSGAMRWLRPQYWSDRSMVKQAMVEGRRFQMPQILEDMQQLGKMQAIEEELEQMEEVARRCFDDAWKGPETDLNNLIRLGNWLITLRKALRAKIVGAVAIALAEKGADRTELQKVLQRAEQDLAAWDAAWKTLCDLIAMQDPGMFDTEVAKVPIDNLSDRLNLMSQRVEALYDWSQYQEALRACESTPLADFLKKAQEAGIGANQLVAATEKRLLRAFLDQAFREREPLRRFNGPSHEATALDFAKLDQQWVEQTSARLRNFLASQRPTGQISAARSSQLGILQGEMRRKRGLRPIRKLLREAGEIIQELKPCFMMSPLSVAQFLDPEGIRFDVVVFDEASQVEPADALGAIARGNQLILVGDDKQLPPTPFFRVMAGDSEETGADTGGAAPLTDMESILDKGVSVFPRVRLRWHYRSRHESLIAFSNYRFYDNELLVFPSCHTDTSRLGLSMTYESGDLYDRGKSQTNRAQAKRVAAHVFEHARQCPNLSLGVGAFSLRQQQAIMDEIEMLRREDDSLEDFFRRDKQEPFFVKNLESIQGDERDIILLSIGHGKSVPGDRLSMGFGPLNLDGGWRRLNVLITRARQQCVVFTSIRGLDFNLAATPAKGVHALKEYLDYAEKGILPLIQVGDGEVGSEFERAVYSALAECGVELHRQVGCCRYAIDLAVVDPNQPGKYILGIECDGAVYHSSSTARDRDRLRQQVLEDLGWRIHRIWSTDWYHKPKEELQRTLEAIEKAKRGQYPAKFGSRTPSKSKIPVIESPAEVVVSSQSSPDPDQLPPFVKEYEQFISSRRLSAKRFYDGGASLASLIAEIVKIEWPIHQEELTRRAADVHGISRIGSRVQGQAYVAIDGCVKCKTIARKGKFLWPPDMDVPPVRHRSGNGRDIEYVCIEEIIEAAWQLLKAQFGMRHDDLITQVARVLGFQRTGNRTETRIREAITHGLRDGRISAGADGVLKARDV